MRVLFSPILATLAVLFLVACPRQETGVDTFTGDGIGQSLVPAPDGAMSLGSPGGIKIVVGLEGSAPTPAPLNRNIDPVCAKVEKLDPSVLAQDGKLQNVVVRIVSDVASDAEVPGEPLQVAGTECMFEPRVSVARSGQKLEIINRDKTMYMVNAYRGEERGSWFSAGQPPGAPPIKRTLEPGMVQLKCGSHPWMAAFVSVADHPFNAVTGEDGTASWDLVPSATEPYKIETWHEVYGKQEVEVLVQPGKVAEAIVTYQVNGAK